MTYAYLIKELVEMLIKLTVENERLKAELKQMKKAVSPNKKK